jgi:hypothetical protein
VESQIALQNRQKQAPILQAANLILRQPSTALPYLVVLKNPPKSIEMPDAHKDFILSPCGKLSDDIVVLKRNRMYWTKCVGNV